MTDHAEVERDDAQTVAAPKVAAMVLNYNGKKVTLETLSSLVAMTYPACNLFVVDNGSTDGSREAVEAQFPDVIQVRTEENLGPAGGLNLGVRHLIPLDYDYILVLNNDIEADPEMLTEMVRLAESDPQIGCVGPKTYYYGDRERLWSAGGIIQFRESVTQERGVDQLDRGQYDEACEVDYIHGCAALIRRSVMAEVGPYDPLFFLAVEDADWCMRMKQLGYRCAYAHRARLWHMVGQTAGVYKPGRTYQTGRSTAIFTRRYANLWQWCRFLVFITLAIPAAFLRELPRGNQGAAISKLRGVLAGLRVPLTDPPSFEN